MKKFKIVPISIEYASKIRKTRKDEFGYDVIEELSMGYGPCRVSLKPFIPYKDFRLIACHTPFEIKNVYNQPGPVFIHKDKVDEYQNIHRFPPEIKADKTNFPLTLIGYDNKQIMMFTQRVGNDDVDELIPQIFNANPEIEFLHARNSEAGCYICKIEKI